MKCVWSISATEGSQVLIDLINFDIEYHSSCVWDEVKASGKSLQSIYIKSFICFYKNKYKVMITYLYMPLYNLYSLYQF